MSTSLPVTPDDGPTALGTTTSADTAILQVVGVAPDRDRRRGTLLTAGFQIRDAESGLAALDAISSDQAIDVVLVDLRPTDTSSFELTRQIKARAASLKRDVGIVLVSPGFSDPELRVRGLECGADACLIHPFTDAELLATLTAVLRVQQALKRAREQERLLDALFDYIPEGITVAEAPDVTVRRVSRYGERLLGRPREVLQDIPASEHPEKWAVFCADGVTRPRPEDLPLTRAATTGEIIEDEEWVMQRATGEQMVVLCNAGPIRDEAGRITGGVIAWRDITLRKHIEQALVAQTEQLREADRAKNEFLAGIAHEMRQPLQAALAAVGVMKARGNRGVGERARDVIERQLQQISRITSDLLDTAQIVRREVTLNRQPTDLREVVGRALETVRPAMTDRAQHVTVSTSEVPVIVDIDAGRLEQVFVNILSNAAKYTPPGGRIDVHVDTHRSKGVVRVRDSGEGIAPEQLPRIFDLFTRATSHGGGFGIGLAVARTLVALHGGTIEARSAGRGHGSEFIVSLPAAQTAPAD